SRSDQLFLDFWEPDAIFNLKTAKLPEVLDQMGYSVLDLTVVESTFFVNATVDGKSGKFLLDPSRGWSTFDPAAAKEIGMNLTDGRINFTDNTGKTSRSKRGAVKEFKAGAVTVTSHEFEVIEVAKMFRAVPANTLGAIGGDLLKRLNALVDFGGKRLFVRQGQ
ncbi:MAG: aspartyl protease family protein, partial [Verrucomicrobiota bacterium]|nr:aspartyl protease family protein [Verrucomicrobiota bacterium]